MTFGYLFHAWLCNVVTGWLSTLKFSNTDDKKQENQEDLDPALKSTQEFAKITGKRAKKTELFIQSLDDFNELGMKLTVLSIVDEPLRFLTFYFLSCNDMAHERPTLIELANDQRSPLTACTQYLSTLLFAEQGRTLLIWKKQNFASVEQWENCKPEQVRSFRRLVLLTIAWIHRRHSDHFLQFPFSLCLLADDDEMVSNRSQQDLLREWDSCFACCVRPGMARTLKKRGINSQDLESKRCLINYLFKVFFTKQSTCNCTILLTNCN